MVTSVKKNVRSKGDRLNWQPLTDSVNMKITPEMLVGKQLSTEDLKHNSNNSTNHRIP
jgi:hypothetical protein